MASKQNILLTGAILGLFSLMMLIVFGDKGLADLNMLKRSRDALVLKNETLLRENLSLYRSIERLKTDPYYIENIARKELGVIRKDEQIFKFQDGKKSAFTD